ncbi:MAG: response regulator [Eubacteriales bacterium]|nr:response regulator [Eubacteriales bacterium]
MYELLLVDDSEPELNCIVYLLRKFSFPFQITTAPDGEEALAILSGKRFDVLMTDIQMPFLDGLGLTRKALALQPDLRVIIISAHEEFSYAKQAIALGVQDYLLKPIEPAELKSVTERILSSIESAQAQKNFEAIASDYIRNHLLLQLLDNDPSIESPQSQRLLAQFFQNYQTLLLLELKQDSFAKNDGLLEEHLKEELGTEHFYYLNITPSLSLLLLDAKLTPRASALASDLIAWAKEVCRSTGFVSYGSFSSLEELRAVYGQLEELLENAFLSPKRQIFPLSLYQEMDEQQEDALSALSGSASGKIREVKQYIYQNYGTALSLNQLAALVFVHPDYLSRLFKKETGMNLNQFIKRFRMEKARELLTRTQMKVSAVGEAVGYGNRSYFCKTFNDFYGVSPEKFREESSAQRTHRKDQAGATGCAGDVKAGSTPRAHRKELGRT